MWCKTPYNNWKVCYVASRGLEWCRVRADWQNFAGAYEFYKFVLKWLWSENGGLLNCWWHRQRRFRGWLCVQVKGLLNEVSRRTIGAHLLTYRALNQWTIRMSHWLSWQDALYWNWCCCVSRAERREFYKLLHSETCTVRVVVLWKLYGTSYCILKTVRYESQYSENCTIRVSVF